MDDDVQPQAKREAARRGGGSALQSPQRYRSPIFPGARNAPRGTLKIASSGSAKLRDSERTEANPIRVREREGGRDYNGFILPRKGGTVLLGNGYFVDDSVVSRWN